MTPHPYLTAVLVAVAIALTCGACTVHTSDAERAVAAAQADATALRHDPATGKVTLDLRTPPTPASIGIPAGSETRSILRDVDGMLDVDVLLPHGNHLRVPAFAVNIALGPNSSPLIVINRDARDLDDADRILHEHAGPLRLNRNDLNTLMEHRRSSPPPMYGGVDNFVLESGLRSYLRLSIELRRSDRDATLNYIFGWDDLTNPVLHPKTPSTKPTTPHKP